MGTSDLIACFIKEMLENEDGCAELQRCDIASRFRCVPSQINYVISTRFSPEHGYIVESRRGGGGYIRIRRVRSDPESMIMHVINAVGDTIDQHCARAFLSNMVGNGIITAYTAQIMTAALCENALRSLPQSQRDTVRAGIFKQMLAQCS